MDKQSVVHSYNGILLSDRSKEMFQGCSCTSPLWAAHDYSTCKVVCGCHCFQKLHASWLSLVPVTARDYLSTCIFGWDQILLFQKPHLPKQYCSPCRTYVSHYLFWATLYQYEHCSGSVETCEIYKLLMKMTPLVFCMEVLLTVPCCNLGFPETPSWVPGWKTHGQHMDITD